MFDTNFWGSTNVSREAVRFFREENKPSGGLLLLNSSLTGIRATAGVAYYSASKHGTVLRTSLMQFELIISVLALEGVTEALAEELDPSWNIKVEFWPVQYCIILTRPRYPLSSLEPSTPVVRRRSERPRSLGSHTQRIARLLFPAMEFVSSLRMAQVKGWVGTLQKLFSAFMTYLSCRALLSVSS